MVSIFYSPRNTGHLFHIVFLQLVELNLTTVLPHLKAVQALSRLDGVSSRIPDIDCFLEMFVLKDATSSAQIEETRATMIDAIEAGNIEKPSNIPIDTKILFITKKL